MRLRHVSPSDPGWTRRRSGRGFVYLDQHGDRLGTDEVGRIKELVIPPAWQDVWISPAPNGHIQAVGSDAAGRRQYVYHAEWRRKRDEDKFDRILTVAQKLPRARKRVLVDLDQDGMPRERALAAAFRMLDLGYFRVGGEAYTEANGSYGLATLLKRHVRSRKSELIFEFRAKSGKDQHIVISDPGLSRAIATLRSRSGGGDELLAYKVGRRWVDVTSSDINDYVKTMLDPQVSAKDFRTWHATVHASIALAMVAPPAVTRTAKKRAAAAAVRAVSEYLGNTPAVARRSYVDPRVLDLYDGGRTIATALTNLGADADFADPAIYGVAERAVGELLSL